MERSVRITVGKGGKISVEAQGISGPTCEPLVRQIADKITGTVTESRHTEAFYEATDAREQTQ